MTREHSIPIRELGAIGDQRSAALVTSNGKVVWYCPGRFDRPSLFGALSDSDCGCWEIADPGQPVWRGYVGASAVLQTVLAYAEEALTITDWMPMGDAMPSGLCRMLSAAPVDIAIRFIPAPDYGRAAPQLLLAEAGCVHVQDDQTLFASHAMTVAHGEVLLRIPAGESGWTALLPRGASPPDSATLGRWYKGTVETWSRISGQDAHRGEYEVAVQNSLRALRLLTHDESGGILAAFTTSLPEVSGGKRNYDYRYVWMRDAGMIASALTRSSGTRRQAERFLDFVCSSSARSSEIFLPPALSLDGGVMPEEQPIATMMGYGGAQPVVVGNNARTQLQLDALGNLLLVAKLVYSTNRDRPHFAMISELADFLVHNWQQPDYGLWEEDRRAQYSSSKVIMACGLEYIADFGSPAQVGRWRDAARAIRTFVEAHCMTSSGAYAAIAGGESVDVSAALFPVWAYCPADTRAMLTTIAEIERDLSDGELYRRHLECFPSAKEGAFLAGTLWMAQYWITRGDLDRARRIIDATLVYSNDLGLFAEEGVPESREMVGNFPQSFVHAAFLGTVFDLVIGANKHSHSERG